MRNRPLFYSWEKVINTGKFTDYTGQRFGMLTVLGLSDEVYIDPKTGWKRKKWKVRCDCGKEYSVCGNCLKSRNGYTKSCGCARGEKKKTHGQSKTKLYEVWCNMKRRCNDETNTHYHIYGGKGIKVCPEWENDFQAFYDWSMSHGYKEGLTIDRIDNSKNYCPDNCRWATLLVQGNNTSRNHLLTYNGETHTMSEWARIININYGTLRSRINDSGWSVEEALTTPLITNQSRKGENNGTSTKSKHN